MNLIACSGSITKVFEPVVFNGGKTTVQKFLVSVKNGNEEQENKKSKELIPCMLFNPSREVSEMLKDERFVELQGKIITSTFSKNNRTSYKTEVLVFPKSLKFF